MENHENLQNIKKEIKAYENEIGKIISEEQKKTLEKVLLQGLTLNSDLSKPNSNNLDYVRNPKDLITIMKIRSISFKSVGNEIEFPDKMKELNFDEFDFGKSFILKYYQNKQNNKIIGTSRLILDSKLGLLSENEYNQNFGYDEYRIKMNKKGEKIGELSRTAILPEFQKTSTFINLMGQIYKTAKDYNVGQIFTAVRDSDASMYERFGMKIIKKLNYGKISNCSILTWNLEHDISKTFKKVVLKER